MRSLMIGWYLLWVDLMIQEGLQGLLQQVLNKNMVEGSQVLLCESGKVTTGCEIVVEGKEVIT